MKKIIITLLIFASAAINAQETNYSDWIAAGQPALQSNGNAPVTPFGGVLSVFPDLASFQPGTVTVFEDFEGGLTGAGIVNGCTPPVNSLSNDPCFTPGDLIPGFNISVSTPGNTVVALGAGIVGNADVVMGANTFSDFTVLTFDDVNVTAVAFDLQTNAAGPVDVRVFDTAGVLLDTLSIAANPSFVGFTSPTAIGSIELEDIGGGGELFDNLRFGTVPPTAVPMMNNLSLGLMSLLMMFFVYRFRRNNT